MPLIGSKMKFSENSDVAVKYLRQAIPTMMQHKIVPNPINYTLWYTYFSNTYPELNKELDHAIERYNTCPMDISESLFLNHIGNTATEEQEANEDFRRALSKMVSNLTQSLDETSSQSNNYSIALKSDIEALANQEIDEQISPLIDNLNSNASAICEMNDAFNKKLVDAQQEIQALKAELSKSRKEATTDPLTGLSNRRVLESIYEEFESGKAVGHEFSLIILDIDKFKVFNDTHGHTMGDQILKFVGSLLREQCKSPTQALRFGGEEFAIVCPGQNAYNASEMAETVRSKLSSVPFINRATGEKIPPVTASFGVCSRQGDESLAHLIERADKALYQAKDNGRNQVQVA